MEQFLETGFFKKSDYVYKFLQSFAGPMNIKIVIESEKCITSESDILAEFVNNGNTYYLFNVTLIKPKSKFSIKIEEIDSKDKNNVRETTVIMKRIEDDKGNSLNSIVMINFYHDRKHTKSYIRNIFESINKAEAHRRNPFAGIDLAIVLKKEEWDNIKCTSKKVLSIEGYFYLYINQGMRATNANEFVLYPLNKLAFMPVEKKNVVHFE